MENAAKALSAAKAAAAAEALAATEAQLKICDGEKDINDVLAETTHLESLASTLTYCRTIIAFLSDKIGEEYHEIAELRQELAKQGDITRKCVVLILKKMQVKSAGAFTALSVCWKMLALILTYNACKA